MGRGVGGQRVPGSGGVMMDRGYQDREGCWWIEGIRMGRGVGGQRVSGWGGVSVDRGYPGWGRVLVGRGCQDGEEKKKVGTG